MSNSPGWVVIIMNCIKTVVAIFDLITLPLHLLIQKPWRKTRLAQQVMVKREDENDPYSTYTSVEKLTDEQQEYFRAMPTVTDLFNYSVEKFSDSRCQGTRTVYAEEEEIQENGKVFKKLVLGDYEWNTFKQVKERVVNFGKGLRALGLEPQDKVVILAETCPEWLIAALGCFEHNMSVVTLYSTLGTDGIISGIQETEVTTVITSQDLLPKLKNVLIKTPKVKSIIFMEKIKRISADSKHFVKNVEYHSFDTIESNGKQTLTDFRIEKPTADSIAVIMYTSGSTGIPKAVLLSHKNIINCTISSSLYEIKPPDVYLAYLPLAHVLELQAECMVMIKGIPIGYSSPLTLTDQSSKLKKGCPGDITVLKPTFMAAVPMILERIQKGIKENLDRQNSLVKAIFEFAIKYKSTYYEFGFDTPFVNWLVCSRLRKLLGGRMRIIASGGAPLSTDVQAYIRSCFNVKVLIGYGLTETCSANSAVRDYDIRSGHVGFITPGSFLKLADWEEGNYRPTDKPNPRGEIVLGGDSVSKGYFKNDSLTDEGFFNKDGTRWFKTGDIGEILPNGSMKIIDRKKDIVKLQTGEYVSLVKVENVIKELPIVDNVCIAVNSLAPYITALIIPNQKTLRALAEKMGKVNGNHNILDHDVLCKEKEVNKKVLEVISNHCQQRRLSKFETPLRIFLCNEAWTPDTGMVTSTYKLKRKAIELKYKSEIKRMF